VIAKDRARSSETPQVSGVGLNTAAQSQVSGYIPSLDGFRAFAVVLVMIAHAGYGHWVPGGLGVSIFFFLSGYLITTLFYRELRSTHRISLPAFYVRRLLRLSPPLLVSLAVGYGLLWLGLAQGGFNLTSIAAQLFYAANYHQLYGDGRAVVEGQSVLWSLAVEEHFYFLYPFPFLWLSKLRRLTAKLWVIVALLAAGLGWRFVLKTLISVPDDHLYYATDARLDSILYGCLLSVLTQEGHVERLLPNSRRHAIWAEGLGLLLLIFTLVYRSEMFRDTVRYSLQGIAFFPIFHYAVHAPHLPWHRWLNYGPIKTIGVYSYSIYLVHHVFIESLKGPFGVTNILVVLALSSVLSWGYAAMIYRVIDQPLMRLRRRLHGHG